MVDIRQSQAEDVKVNDLHPWGKLPKKANVSGENKPYDEFPESAWVVCRWCGMRNNTARDVRCRHCDSDNYY